jgi:hypothetical protein
MSSVNLSPSVIEHYPEKTYTEYLVPSVTLGTVCTECFLA